ncbi:5-oxoprolinase subunit C family protein [Tenacibaculum agarivorans]|uniref:5-oxoprolinase subunit C family protein n=1 Tax=Tenacibaculum agarivorans TaxID=1908389 RepID=UPI00094BC3DE|nr:biotin-dependent carboxyltransferase family protein [Tenacibaculum agarivorans]
MIKVIHPGILMTIQDQGRVGFAHQGVPISGAMDLYAHNIANALVNNDEDQATIEITMGACTLEFLTDCEVSLTGGNFSPTLNESPLVMNKKLNVAEGSILKLGKRVYGTRTYLAIAGGIISEKILGSQSYYKSITDSFFLKKGDHIQIRNKKTTNKTSYAKLGEGDIYTNEPLTCYKGPEFERLTKEQQERIVTEAFTISRNNSRMGYILNESLENNLGSMLSSGVLPGTVQLTPSGKLIVLMRDCQVTGGYPRVLQLTEQSINKLAQKTTAEKVNFKIVG